MYFGQKFDNIEYSNDFLKIKIYKVCLNLDLISENLNVFNNKENKFNIITNGICSRWCWQNTHQTPEIIQAFTNQEANEANKDSGSYCSPSMES